ncbi:hypothetical protein SB912_33470, partial [Pantoea sp. SIMBA_072]
EELASQNRQTLDLYVANLLGTLHRYETLPQILGDLPALRGVLADPVQPVQRPGPDRRLHPAGLHLADHEDRGAAAAADA